MTENSRKSRPATRAATTLENRKGCNGRIEDAATARDREDATNPEIFDTDENGRVSRGSGGGTMVEAVMRSAADEGLTLAKDGRIAGRVSSALIARAKARTGLESDTELVEFALATVALDDSFAEIFREVKGSVDREIDFSF